MRKFVFVLLAFLVVAMGSAWAQLPFNIHGGGGWTTPTGDQSGRFETGGHYTVGGGFSILPLLDLQVDYMHTSLGLSRSYINSQPASDGHGVVNSVTVDPRLHVGLPGTRLGVYGLAGLGYYRRTIEFNRPDFKLHNGALGYNIGGGVTYKVVSAASLYFEVRYHDAVTGRGNTQMVPFTLGIRF
jgi:hypothetical protein